MRYAALALAATLVPAAGVAATVAPAYIFQGPGGHDLQGGGAGLVAGPDGTLYGTAPGSQFDGAVYRMLPARDGHLRPDILHHFHLGRRHGPNQPNGALALDGAGNLYGTTYYGGAGGNGVVFRLAPPSGGATAWQYSTLASFDCRKPQDGCGLEAGVTLGPDGTLYGATVGGGPDQLGTIFRLLPPKSGRTHWRKQIIWSFTAASGSSPTGEVVLDASGTVYAITSYDGAHGHGTIVALHPPSQQGGSWTETTLQDLDETTGYLPLAGMIADGAGTLYGITSAGGPGGRGTIFALTPGGNPAFRVLHASSGAPDFLNPYGKLALLPGGALLGTSYYGGTGGCSADGCGVVFRLDRPHDKSGNWKETLIYNFSGAAGYFPWTGPIAAANGAYYGTTTSGGLQGEYSYGVLYRLTAP